MKSNSIFPVLNYAILGLLLMSAGRLYAQAGSSGSGHCDTPNPPQPPNICAVWNSETCQWEGQPYTDACGQPVCEEPPPGLQCCDTEPYDPRDFGCCNGGLYSPSIAGCCNETEIYTLGVDGCCTDGVASADEECCSDGAGGTTVRPRGECQFCDDGTYPDSNQVCCYDPGSGGTTATDSDKCCSDGIAGAGEVCCNDLVTAASDCCGDGTRAGPDEVCCIGSDGVTTATALNDCCGGEVLQAGERCCDDSTIAHEGEVCCAAMGGESTAKTREQCCADNGNPSGSGYSEGTLCLGNSFNVNAQGGVAPYTYSSSDPSKVTVGASSGEVQAVAVGSVEITIKDSNGCEGKVQVEATDSKCVTCAADSDKGSLLATGVHYMQVGQTFTPNASSYVSGTPNMGAVPNDCPAYQGVVTGCALPPGTVTYRADPLELEPTSAGTYTIDIYASIPRPTQCVEQNGGGAYLEERIGAVTVNVCQPLSVAVSSPITGLSYPVGAVSFSAIGTPSGGTYGWAGDDFGTKTGSQFSYTFSSAGAKSATVVYYHPQGCSTPDSRVTFNVVGVASLSGTDAFGTITSTTSSPGDSETLYFAKRPAGSAPLTLTAVPTAPGGWPAGQPIWSGASSSGTAGSATFSLTSASSSAAGTTVTVGCGSSVKSIKIVVVDFTFTLAQAERVLLQDTSYTFTSTPSGFNYLVKYRRDAGSIWTSVYEGQQLTATRREKVSGNFKVRGGIEFSRGNLYSDEKSLEVKFPSYAEILANSQFQQKAAAAWASTKAATTPTGRREEGFWVKLNTVTEAIEFKEPNDIGPIVGNNSGASVVPSSLSPSEPLAPLIGESPVYRIAYFHTHTSNQYRPLLRPVGPSSASPQDPALGDEDFANAFDIVGIVYDYVGTITVNGLDAIPSGHPTESGGRFYSYGPNRRSTSP